MQRYFRLWFFILVLSRPLFPDSFLQQVDILIADKTWGTAREMLLENLDNLTPDSEKAEVYWRLARISMGEGLAAEKAGVKKTTLLSIFQEGDARADLAIRSDPRNYNGYYWKVANLGKWSQVKGLFNAFAQVKTLKGLLLKALECKPDHADSYYVLAQLYARLPGFPVSYGNVDYAVSLGRFAVFLHDRQLACGNRENKDYDFYLELAGHLIRRNWSVKKRREKQPGKLAEYQANNHPVEKRFFYEGTIELDDLRDREEAGRIVNDVIRELESLPVLTEGQQEVLEKAAGMMIN